MQPFLHDDAHVHSNSDLLHDRGDDARVHAHVRGHGHGRDSSSDPLRDRGDDARGHDHVRGHVRSSSDLLRDRGDDARVHDHAHGHDHGSSNLLHHVHGDDLPRGNDFCGYGEMFRCLPR